MSNLFFALKKDKVVCIWHKTFHIHLIDRICIQNFNAPNIQQLYDIIDRHCIQKPQCAKYPTALRSLPSNTQRHRLHSRRDSLLHRPRRNRTRIKRRTTPIHQRAPLTRKHGPRRDRRRTDEVRALNRAQTLAGLEREPAAGRSGGEGGAGAADVPGAGADDAALCCAAGGDLEGSCAGEGGSGGVGAGSGGGGGCAGAGFGEVFDARCWAV